MHSESEIRDDMDKLRAYIEALMDKYGDDFSCILSAGVAMDECWAGSCLSYGETPLLHQACHGLLENPRFIDEFFDAVKCVALKQDHPDFLKPIISKSVDSMKFMLIKETKQFKEHEIDEAVQDLLRKSGFSN